MSISAKLSIVFLLLALLSLSGCGQIAYYSQSVAGHSRLMLARESLPKAIQEAEQEGQAELATTLQRAKSMRAFAVEVLDLPDNGSYQSDVALDSKYPIWNVVAAEEFSVEPVQWCYLVIGCATYRGYFEREDALRYAQEKQQSGYETSVGGVVAYSTLGWFNDPLLPSMFERGESQLAEIMFHELAHQVLYVNGRSDFNEAFATVVGERGAELWLRQHNPALLPDYQNQRTAYREFVSLLLSTRDKLGELYASEAPQEEMRLQKQQVFAQLRTDYEKLKAQRWQNAGWFDGWFQAPPNNARLSALATYYERVPEIEALLLECEQDFARFYQKLEETQKDDNAKIPNEC